MVHAGQKSHQLTYVDRLQKHHLIHAQRHDIAARIAAGAGIGNLVQQFQDGAPVHIAGEVGHVRRHEHGHAQLVGWCIHGARF